MREEEEGEKEREKDEWLRSARKNEMPVWV